MGDYKKLLFENFKENLNNDSFGELKKIYIERDILSCFSSAKMQYKFKLDLNEVIYSLNSSEIMKNEEYSENEMKEKSLEFKTINEINEGNQDNLERCSISNIRIQNPLSINNANSDDCYIEIQLYIGKNLIILFNLEEKLIIISSFAGQNNNNDNYYLLDLLLIMKFKKLLSLNEVKLIILEIEKFDNIKKYSIHKISEDKSPISKNDIEIYQLYKDNINKLNNDINKKRIRSQKSIRKNLNINKINKNSNNINLNNDDDFEEEEMEINTGENNKINDIKDENKETQKNKKLIKKEVKKKPIKVKASFEIEEIFKSFGFLQVHDHAKTILSIIILFSILCKIIKTIFF